MRAFHPHPPVGVQQDVLSAVVFKARGNQRSEFPDQLFVPPFGHLQNFLHQSCPFALTFSVLYTSQWCYTYTGVCIARLRYYARVERLSSQKQMTAAFTSGAVERQSRAMGAKAFEIGLFDPNAKQGSMLQRVWNLDTLMQSLSWLRLKNSEE